MCSAISSSFIPSQNIIGNGVRVSNIIYANNNCISLKKNNIRTMTWDEINWLDKCIKYKKYFKFELNISPNYEIY